MHKQGLRRAVWPVVVAATALTACSSSDFMPANPDRDGTAAVTASVDAEGDELVLLEQQQEARRRVSSQRAIQGQTQLRKYEAALMLHTLVLPRPAPPPIEADRESYGEINENPLKLVSQQPVSTFSIDVDTGAYANVRRFLLDGRLPPANAVRVEEMLNYFNYGYAGPVHGNTPFSVTTELGVTPWNQSTRLLQIGVQGLRLKPHEVPASNLVFLIDVSGSMRSQAKLGLLKACLKMLTNQLRAEDRVTLVVYAGSSGVVLEPTPGNQKHKIVSALESLRAGGGTHGAAGIRLAYAKARQAFIPGGVNRVLLVTDGDFNVGTTNFDALKNLIKRERASGVSLTTLGFGTGNLNERLMEQLANVGNGNYAYIDSAREANKVLVQQMAGTLATIAKDVKIQIEFNPAVVSEYRLIGYENRQLRREDFRNDKVDAGEIGAGHSVTALYEVTLAGTDSGRFAPLRYQPNGTSKADAAGAGKVVRGTEMAFLRMRYKATGGSKSNLVVTPIAAPGHMSVNHSGRFKLAAAVAGFGQLLRDGRYIQAFGFDDVVRLATAADVPDTDGYVAEFRQLANVAKALTGHQNLQSRVSIQNE